MPATGQPTTVQQAEHRSILNTIDYYYMESGKAQAWMRTWLIVRIGPMKEPFLYFFQNFMTLFTLTHKHKEMAAFKDVAAKVTKWSESPEITISRCKEGIALFDDWQDALLKAGLISVRK